MANIKLYSASTQSSDSSAPKGSASNPYTEEEFYRMLDDGTWTGGNVVGMGYVLPDATVLGSSNYDSDSWSDPWGSVSDPWGSSDDGSGSSGNGNNSTGTGGNTGSGGNNNSNSGSTGNNGSNTSTGNNTSNNNVPQGFPVPPNNIEKAGVRIYSEQFKTSANSTLSRFTVAAYNADGQIIDNEVFTGYFLERAYDPYKANVANSGTAIAPGTYPVVPKQPEQTYDWYLSGVDGRNGIAIHVGNTYDNSTGCLLIGQTYGTSGGDYKVSNSGIWMKKLSNLLNQYGKNNIVIIIKR